MPILSLHNVSIAYGSLVAVEDVSFGVREGDFVCIVGANGSGKSTLVRAVLGLIPVSGGDVRLGTPQVAYVPQVERADREFPATVQEIVLTGTQRAGRRIPFYTARDKEDAREAMESLGIADLAKTQIGRLSGGQRQRVLLARAMCRSPRLLFLDEPCSGLDAATKRAFYATLARLHRERDTAVVMVSHDLDDVATHADRVAVMARSLVFLGDVEEWKKGAWRQGVFGAEEARR